MEDMTGWFAGLVDGEGCFMLHVTKRGNRSVGVQPVFAINMNDGGWVQPVSDILTTNGIPFSKRRIHETMVYIQVSGISNVKKVCKLVAPFTVIKKPLVERLTNYIGRSVSDRLNEIDILRIADDVDFVRAFNRKKNIPYKWDGDKICEVYGITRNKSVPHGTKTNQCGDAREVDGTALRTQRLVH